MTTETTSRPLRSDPDQLTAGSARMRVTDKVATVVITAGGLSVIAAVLGICLYLVFVTLPLLAPGKSEVVAASTISQRSACTGLMIDEYRTVAALVRADGVVEIRELATGKLLDERHEIVEAIGDTTAPPVIDLDDVTGDLVVAADGRVLWGKIGFGHSIRDDGGPGDATVVMTSPLADGRTRATSLDISLVGEAEHPHPVVAVDSFEDRRRVLIAGVDDQGQLVVWTLQKSRSLVAGSTSADAKAIRIEQTDRLGDVAGVRVLEGGGCLVVGADASFQRYQIGRSAGSLAESGRLWSEDTRVTAMETLLGRKTVAAGTSDGRVGTWWVARDPQDNKDPGRLVAGFAEHRGAHEITAIAASHRDRSLLIGDAGGQLAVVHSTSGKVVARIDAGGSVDIAGFAPKLDGFASVSSDLFRVAELDVGHPDATVRSLFGAVLYEGQSEPGYVYQASGASDSTEPKLSLVPLIFGTLKATIFSMLFAAPIAIFAAIYTSEFMDERLRRVIKPLLETMASLPSVVLGFVAAMVVAPFVAGHLSVVLASFVVVPVLVMLVSAICGMAAKPGNEARGGLWLPGLVLAVSVGGLLLSVVFAGPLERAVFAPSRGEVLVLAGSADAAESGAAGTVTVGSDAFVPREPTTDEARSRVAGVEAAFSRPSSSLKGWLSGVYGRAWSGWIAVLAPLASLVVFGFGWPALSRLTPQLTESRLGPLMRVVVSIGVGAAVGGVIAGVLTRMGIDARDSFLGAFTQRNTLVIGIVMGFAIIPIVFTISDDAMRSVPSNLRAASLGAGATRWQTTVRVVLPVAASGIFSATMIGLGRAVGETMIVLMATGNTPVMDWNIFEGLRTLSANIAVELPEAERGGTHYRLLFMCGVVLFAMTFVVNTTAEIVRQRFRKRNALL